MNEARGKLAGVSKPLSDIKVRKLNSCVVKPIDDYPPGCLTTGMAITKDKQWLLVDKSSDIVNFFLTEHGVPVFYRTTRRCSADSCSR